jgi:hypothetical protein
VISSDITLSKFSYGSSYKRIVILSEVALYSQPHLKCVGFEVIMAVTGKSTVLRVVTQVCSGFLLGLLFCPEDGGDMFLLNVLPTTLLFNPKDRVLI